MAKITPNPSLFPILPQLPTGIARMAAESRHADDGHLIEFKTLAVRSILNRTVSRRMLWMAYSINPYRGCEFGCCYCYARYTHEFMAPKTPESPDRTSEKTTPPPASLHDPEPIDIHDQQFWRVCGEVRDADYQLSRGGDTGCGTGTRRRGPRLRRNFLRKAARTAQTC